MQHAADRADRAEAELAALRRQVASGEGMRRAEVAAKQPPSPSSGGDAKASGGEAKVGGGEAEAGGGEVAASGGEEELRKDSMMVHLLDSLAAGKDIGHYGRLVFAMVACHFMPHREVIGWLTRDCDFSKEDAEFMLRQTEGRDYSPPRRARLLEWQAQQEFPILPHPDDPDCGNLYRNLKFPPEVYAHIGHYQEQKAEAGV